MIRGLSTQAIWYHVTCQNSATHREKSEAVLLRFYRLAADTRAIDLLFRWGQATSDRCQLSHRGRSGTKDWLNKKRAGTRCIV